MSSTPIILVTGGAGFVGSHLIERLLADGCRVRAIDDLSTGSLANLEGCRADPRFELATSRVSEFAPLSTWIRESAFVFHLAAAVGVELVVRSPVRTIQTNLRETEAVLEAAMPHRIPVLITSTSEVYGKSSRPAFAETDDLIIGPPTLARWSYACSKLMDEFLAMAYGRERGLPVILTRVFNTVGPRQTGRYGMVLPRFVQAALQHQPLRVYGDGGQRRCFCDVADTVEALVRLHQCPAAHGEVVNVGNDQETSILDLAHRVVSLLQSPSTIVQVPYHEAYAPGFEDMARRRPVLDKLLQLTRFRPATPLDAIIQRVAAASA